MRVPIFTPRFYPATDAFDDSTVHEFLADKDVRSIREHFFVKDAVPTPVIPYLVSSRFARPRG